MYAHLVDDGHAVISFSRHAKTSRTCRKQIRWLIPRSSVCWSTGKGLVIPCPLGIWVPRTLLRRRRTGWRRKHSLAPSLAAACGRGPCGGLHWSCSGWRGRAVPSVSYRLLRTPRRLPGRRPPLAIGGCVPRRGPHPHGIGVHVGVAKAGVVMAVDPRSKSVHDGVIMGISQRDAEPARSSGASAPLDAQGRS